MGNIKSKPDKAAESAPGKKDFASFEIDYGQIMRFWGNQVTHYTVPNETDISRVSIDFRVIPKSCYIEDCKQDFKIGGFYNYMDAQGNIVNDNLKGIPP